MVGHQNDRERQGGGVGPRRVEGCRAAEEDGEFEQQPHGARGRDDGVSGAGLVARGREDPQAAATSTGTATTVTYRSPCGETCQAQYPKHTNAVTSSTSRSASMAGW